MKDLKLLFMVMKFLCLYSQELGPHRTRKCRAENLVRSLESNRVYRHCENMSASHTAVIVNMPDVLRRKKLQLNKGVDVSANSGSGK